MDNYQQLVERISKVANISSEEIDRKVEAKRAKLSGLVSREGAAQIVAAELGINLDQEKLKLNEVVQGMKRANVVGKVIEVFPIREFNKNGREGKVANLLVADDTTNVRVVLWDTNHISLIEQGKIKSGDVIEISNANVRNGELHLSSFADIKISKEKIDSVVQEKVYSVKKISEVKPGMGVKIRAFIIQCYEPRYFEVSKKTGRKPTQEELDNNSELEKRALLNLVLDDGSETIRATLFGKQINNLGLSDEEIFSLEKFEARKLELIGAEKWFIGNVRENTLYNSTDLNIEKVENIDFDSLIKELEK